MFKRAPEPGAANAAFGNEAVDVGRPVITTSRIDKYDGDLVTFHYNRHEDNKLIYETIPALEFMQRLIQHIPEKNFKIIRYPVYG